MTVFLLWEEDRVYGRNAFIGVFSTRKLAELWAAKNPVKETITRFQDHEEVAQTPVHYRVDEAGLDVGRLP